MEQAQEQINEQPQQPQTIQVDANLFNSLVNYVISRPAGEVFGLVEALKSAGYVSLRK